MSTPAQSGPGRSNEAEHRARRAMLIVGVGASSGGLDAFSRLLRPVPAQSGLAFVLIQHLDRTRPSSLVQILTPTTVLTVQEATDGVQIEANHVYIIPPGSDLSIADGKLKLEPRGEKSATHYPVDRFFQSLAADQGPLAVGIVLSGSGSDGTQGLLAIKEACGVTFAQEESSADFSIMPHSAIAAGAVDFVLKPGEMVAELLKVESQSWTAAQSVDQIKTDVGNDNTPELKKIFALLQKATKTDFTHYKRKPVSRRIARRMVVHKLKDLSDYARLLESDPAELAKLYREILINVTSFFREPASFEQLMTLWREKNQQRTTNQPIRAWVAACATGEEAYSVAICLMELAEETGHRSAIQIFGTDINETALEAARGGVYPETIANDVSAERLARFFTPVDRGYQVNKSIRECCVFARHDLTCDPPFSRLDLLSCRNVLIYMGAVLQKRVIPMFHYSLKAGGLLMLGSAEALAGNADLFELLDKQNKLFQRQARPVRFTPEFDFRKGPELEEAPTPVPVAGQDLEAMAVRTIRDRFATDGVVIDGDLRIVLFRGHTSLYLDPAPGNPSFHLLRMVREDLAFKLEGMISRAVQQNMAVRETGIRLSRQEQSYLVNLEVIPLQNAAGSELYYLVSFESEADESASDPNQPKTSTSDDARLKQYEQELGEARGHLRGMAEDHEAAVEELRAANEEVRSTNEELQSTNEELGTAKEELQSTNEELSTVNEELLTKNSTLAALGDDLRNLFNAASLPILMVDNSLRLRRFTPAAESFLKLLSSDIGRTITDFRLTIDVPQFRQLLEKTIRDLSISTLTVLAANQCWYTVTIRPYRTAENRIEGAVVTFTDIDALKRSLNEAQDAREYTQSILDTLWEPLIVLDSEMCVQRATVGFYRAFQVTKEETEGRSFFELGNGQWDSPRLRTLLEDVLHRNTSFEDYEVEYSFPKLGFRSMRLNARRIRGKSDGAEAILIAIDDITDRRDAAEVRYRRLFESAKDGILELDGDSGDILDVNPYFTQLASCTRSDLVGKKLWETGVFEMNPRLGDLVTETRRREAVRLDSVSVIGRDGRRFETEMICNRYMVAEEALIQCNIRDITERKQADDELRRSNEDLQQFAYAASHDLQEPMRMVGAFTQLIDKKFRPQADEEGSRYFKAIAESVNRMEQLLKDLLQYSQASVHDSQPTPVRAERVLSVTLMNLQLAMSDTGTVVTNDPLPVVKADQMHLVQVFQNLIANAIKYRRPDVSPQIHISAVRREDQWLFSVKDNGLGFDIQYASQIFGVFKRLHGKSYPGTGIGLALCKKIIERAGGKIWAESVVGEGSTFYFTVPDGNSLR
jgi:two-component system CheB/CheR fusion protein